MARFSFFGKYRMTEDPAAKPEHPWHHCQIHCLDFEGSLRSGIIEYGLVTIQHMDVLSMHTRLCKGEGPIPEMESLTHQIRDEDVNDAESLSSDWELFRDKRSSGPFAAHHAGVENGLLKSVWPYTSPSKDFISGHYEVDWGPWLDTCSLYRSLFPGLPSYNLEALVTYFGLAEKLNGLAKVYCPGQRSSYHCASYDALGSAVLLFQLKAYEEIHEMSLSQLLQWSQPGNQNSGLSQLELL